MQKIVKKCICVCLLFLFVTGTALPVFAAQQVNLNQASVEQLMEVKGIGQKTAQMIIDYRHEYGNFSSVDDLVNVKGIGQKKLESLREILTVAEDS